MHIQPYALDAEVYEEQVAYVALVTKLQAIELLIASEHYVNTLQEPIFVDVE